MDTYPPAARAQRGMPRSLVAVALAGLFLVALGPVAFAAPDDEVPGNNGNVKIHEGAGEPASEIRNEPHVCTFHLHFFFADAGDAGTWEIQEWSPGDKGVVVLEGTYLTDENGEDRDTGRRRVLAARRSLQAVLGRRSRDEQARQAQGLLGRMRGHPDRHTRPTGTPPPTRTPGPTGTPAPTGPCPDRDTRPDREHPSRPASRVRPAHRPRPAGGPHRDPRRDRHTGPDPTPVSGGVGPIEGTPTPQPPNDAVGGATATPGTTLPDRCGR